MSFGPGVFFLERWEVMDKTFKTFDEQVALLKSRGVEFKTPMSKSFAKKILQRENYYNLINGYKDLFLLKGVSEETFKEGTTVDEIYALYSFDRELRQIFLEYILRIENNVKTLIAYYFSKKYLVVLEV